MSADHEIHPAQEAGIAILPAVKDAAKREPHWDAVRALFMLLGIPFHAIHPYQTQETWVIDSTSTSTGLTAVMEFLHMFRMPGFFIIAGYFAAMLLARREPGVWLQSRMKRLGIPLLFGLLVLIPMMNLCATMQRAAASVALTEWANEALPLNRTTTGHLWFLIVLLYYSTILAAVTLCLPNRRLPEIAPAYARAIERNTLFLLIGICVAIGLYALIAGRISGPLLTPKSFAVDVLSLAFALNYAPYFALGVLVQRTPGLRLGFTRIMMPLTVIGFAAAAVLLSMGMSLPWKVVCVLRALAAIGIAQTCIAVAFAVIKREQAWIKEIVDGSFAIYLLHVPVMIGVFWFVERTGLPVPMRFAMLTVITAALCWAAWKFIKPRPVLQLLFSGVPLPERDRQASPAYP